MSNVAPHSIESEKVTLGACLFSETATAEAAAILSPDDFYRSAHQVIFAGILSLSELGHNVDVLTLAEHLSKQDLSACGGRSYIAGLTDGVPLSTNVAQYAGTVLGKSKLRKARDVLVDSIKSIDSGERIDAASVADTVTGELADAAMLSTKSMSVYEAARSFASDVGKEGGQPIPTGYLDIDKVLGGGVRRGTLTIVAARPSVGKTTMVLRWLQSMAWKKHTCVFFSLELGIKPVAGRILSWMSGFPQADIEQGKVVSEWSCVTDNVTRMKDVPLVLDDSAQTLSQILAIVRQAKRIGEISCVAVDYLQLLAVEHRSRSMTEAVTGLSRGLKRLAQTENVAVIALSQLSRASEGRTDKRPHLSDLRESGALEQDADVCLLLFREEMHNPSPENAGIAECIVAKNRMTGLTGTIGLVFDKRMAIFRDMARGS